MIKGGNTLKLFKEEHGISLVEVVASIVLISVILLSFFTLFIQTKKTSIQSETIQNATYVAQVEMEEIYSISQNLSIDSSATIINQLKAKSFTHISTDFLSGCDATLSVPEEYVNAIKLEKESPPFDVIVTISKLCDYKKAGHVTIEVFDSSNNEKAFVENIYLWN